VAASTALPPAGASLKALLDDPAATTDIDSAYAAVTARWGHTYERRPGEQPCEAVRRRGLECLARRGTWNVVRRFDLPVVLEIVPASGRRRFLGVTAIDESRATVHAGSRRELVSVQQIEREWDGSLVVLWRPPRIGMGSIGRTAREADVAWLHQQLGALEGQPVAPLASARAYDESLAARVTAFQRAHGLLDDGIAGEETLAKLTAMLDPAAPALRRAPQMDR
jgi:general secretion pathway protein A